ncbi:MAG: hypothetical protein ACK463_15740, partial [Bradyrhizobium sp.]
MLTSLIDTHKPNGALDWLRGRKLDHDYQPTPDNPSTPSRIIESGRLIHLAWDSKDDPDDHTPAHSQRRRPPRTGCACNTGDPG